LFRDGEAEAGSAEAPGGGGIDLGEGGEEFAEVFPGDTDTGIDDPEAECGLDIIGGLEVHLDRDATLTGEFDGISSQVEEDLAEAARIAAESGGDFRGDEAGEFEVFFLGFDAEEFGGFLNGCDQVELDVLHFEAVGLDFGVIEDVID
jgi:hypothetical protein